MLSKEVESQTGVTISRDTIRRTLQRNGMHGCHPRKKSSPKAQAQKSLPRVCQGPCWQRWRLLGLYTLEWWDQDKCFWNLMASKLYGIAKVRNTKTNAWCLQWNMVVAVYLMWGCMSAAGVGELHFIDDIMNSQMYCSVLKEKMLPSLSALGRHALFQHDNDPKHTSKAPVGFMKKNRVKVIQWPSMSPDLNPIEHLWGILKRQVEHHSPSSIQSLKEVILEEWKKIDLAKCRQLVHSMPRRLGAVIKNHGGHTKY